MNSKNNKFLKFMYIILVILLLIYGYKYLIINANIPTNSMDPILCPGDKIIVNQFFYRYFGTPERFDVLVFKFPENESMLYVKRLIGLPNDTVEIKNGELYINNEKMDEPYINEKFEGDYGPYVVPEGEYFFLGDNRNHSYDSRKWHYPYVKREKIIGKVVLKYSPEFVKFN